MDLYGILERLCLATSVSGRESKVREEISDIIAPFVDSVSVDALGNLIALKKGKGERKIMLCAHMDEIGFIVNFIEDNGMVRVGTLGGIRLAAASFGFVVSEKGALGALCANADAKPEDYKADVMYIDIGADSRDDALSVVGIGDSVCFDSEFAETESTIRSKAIDDRFGCLVLIELIKSDLKYDTDFAFVVQEEVGLRGAKVAAYSIDPEFALVIETTTAADIPEIEPTKQVCTLGEGAVVSVMDRTTIYDKGLVKAAFETAEQIGVKAQYKRAVAGGNDAGIIHKSNGGIRTLAISLACRYLHAPNCVANKSDCESVMLIAHKMAEKIAGGEL